MRRRLGAYLMASSVLGVACAQAQTKLDRADPAIVQESLPRPQAEAEPPVTLPMQDAPDGPAASRASAPVSAIVVEGGPEIDRAAFSNVLVPFIGRELSGADLRELAGAVAAVARRRGFPFSSVAVERQTLDAGILRLRLTLGSIAAVRVIGATHALADRMLSHALVTGRPVHRSQLERAILLVGDLPGLTVTESKYIMQDGFGILLVTVKQDIASAYVQIDNRGSSEVGPIRSTILGSLRNLASSGDELGIIVSQTPLNPTEFAFGRLRYTTPVDAHGAMLSLAGSYGRAEPGASLQPLDVLGISYDAAIGLSAPVVRSRAHSLWMNAELRTLRTRQSLLGKKLRDDQLTILAGSVTGSSNLAGGIVRADLSVVAGLPFGWVTRQTDRLKSRVDGDGQFATIGYTIDWTIDLLADVTMVLASQGQLASRPLLAAMEIGNGGPAFGRGYDYAERTGDNGILGSVELRADMGILDGKLIRRSQVYGFFDGGVVGNLGVGEGGGALASTGGGLRLGGRIIDGMIEVAFPLTGDRFDTGDKRPRVSFRLSKAL